MRLQVSRFILTIALLASCLLANGGTALQAQDHHSSEPMKLFSRVWQVIREGHYDPRFAGREWQEVRERFRPRIEAARDREELYRILKEMLEEADSSHTAFIPTYNGQQGDIGILIKRIGDRACITKVFPNSPAERAGLKVGDEIVSVDGVPARRLQVNPVKSELRGRRGTPVTIELRYPNGRVVKRQIVRDEINYELPIESRQLPSGIGYIRIYNFADPERVPQFKEAINRLKDAPGLIIDVRGPNGGYPAIVGNILGYFVGRVEMMTLTARNGKPSVAFTTPQKERYEGKVVVIVDERSRSGQEIFANTLREQGRALIVGTRSCGCVEGGVYVRLSGEAVVEVSRLSIVTPRNGNLERVGVIPDKIVNITIEDIVGGRDPQLAAAEAELLSQIASQQSKSLLKSAR